MSDGLAYSAPEAQGIPSAAVASFVAAVEEQVDALHTVMLIRHGHVVAEGAWRPYRTDWHRMMFSVSKSFTSTAVGLAVADGLLSVEDLVVSFFPDIVEQPTGNLAAMRVRHLLTMTTGHAEDTGPRLQVRPDGDWVRAFFALDVEYEPGNPFVYNSGASYILSAIVQRLTGQTLLDYLQPRLLDPMGITGATWESCPKGINAGGWGLNLRTPDLAKFGQLYLHDGEWQGRQLVPAAWCQEATAAHAESEGSPGAVDSRQGYGYQFWRCRHGAYRADGAFGQFCVIMPDQDAVLAMTGGMADTQPVLDLVWEHLLPAMGDATLAADEEAESALRQRLATLRLPAQQDKPSAMAASVSGRTYVVADPVGAVAQRSDYLSPIEAITVTEKSGRWLVAVQEADGTREFDCGDGEWRLGQFTMPDWAGTMAVSGGWMADDTFVMRVCYPGMPFIRTYTARFAGDDLILSVANNVAFGPTEFPPILATAA